jgi:hypothetical protein
MQYGELIMGKSKNKAAKIEGLRKHREQVRAKKKAKKERKKVTLPSSYKKKK